MKRLFLGIPLSEKVKEKVKQIMVELRKTEADLKLVPVENIHFTLKFLGTIDESKFDEIVKKVKELEIPHFSLLVKGVGTFPYSERIQTIWVGAEEGELKILLKKVNIALSYLRKEEREEVPHATLARVKSGKNKEKLREIVQKLSSTDFGEMRVDRIILYESELTPEGAKYTVVKEIGLVGK